MHSIFRKYITAAAHKFELEMITRSGSRNGVPTDVFVRLFGGDASNYEDYETYSKQVGHIDKNNCSPFIALAGSRIELGKSTFFVFEVSGRKNVALPTRLAVGHDNADTSTDWLIERVSLYLNSIL